METPPAGQREKVEEMKECLEDFASAQEKRAYIQGYADCVQALYHMGLLKQNEGLKWVERIRCSLKGVVMTFTAFRKHFATKELFE